jgi:hypothetical protein
MSVFWKDPDDKTTVILTKSNNEILTLSVGDFITYEGRPEGARIEGFTQKSSDPRGPIGMIYLPWRPLKNCWATKVWTFKGDPRHIIASPVGYIHYGEHLNWDTVFLMNGGLCPISTKLE